MKLIRYEGENVTPSDDAILYRTFLSDGLFATVTPTFTSGDITIPAMRGVICGRDFTTDIETLTAVLASSGTITGQIYMWIDMEDVTYPLSIKIRNSVGSLSDDDINNGGRYYGLEIAQYTANTSAVTGVTLTVGLVGFNGLVNLESDISDLESGKADVTTRTTDTTSTTPTISLVTNNEYIFSDDAITTLGITLSSGYTAGFIASVVFVSPASAPTVTLTNTGSYTIKTKGDGTWASLVLTPKASKTVTMIFNYDGINMNIYVSEV